MTAKERIIAETKLPLTTRMRLYFQPKSIEAKLFRLLVQKQEMLEREMEITASMLKSAELATMASHNMRLLEKRDDTIRQLTAEKGMLQTIVGIIAYHATTALEKSTTTQELLRVVLRLILEDAKKVLPKDHDTSVQPEPKPLKDLVAGITPENKHNLTEK